MKRLNLGEWASVAEIVAAGAVVVSLFFVGFEIRRNTRATQAATLQSAIDIARQQVLLMASNAELNRISMVGDNDPSKLNADEKLRFFWQDRSLWLGMQTLYRQWTLGVLPDEEWSVYKKVICVNIGGRGTRALWSQERGTLIPAFVKIVEACDTFASTPTGGAFDAVTR